MAVAVVTGASRGLGRAVAARLAERGWALVIDARNGEDLSRAATEIGAAGSDVVALPGDVADAEHRAALLGAAERLGGLDLLINNASVLGPSPQPNLAQYPLEVLRHVYEVNTFAPLVLMGSALPLLTRSADPRILNVTSDASIEPYQGWGGYGSSKAALDHLSLIFAAEHPGIRVWAVDPGDMRTQMHQEAFPGEDISDRPLPESVVPALINLIEGPKESGRYKVSDLEPATTGER